MLYEKEAEFISKIISSSKLLHNYGIVIENFFNDRLNFINQGQTGLETYRMLTFGEKFCRRSVCVGG